MARIYIAEDDADIRTILTQSLLEAGHEVHSGDDGRAALGAILDDPPDLVVLDIMMPELDGFGLLEALDESGSRPDTKVLILSARNTERERVEGFERGADLYLTKPLDHEEFVAAVTALLESTPQELAAKREQEMNKASLLAQLESVFQAPSS
jgi:DNA-binding response OmpR family regulator